MSHFTEQIGDGDGYEKIQQVISIIITDYVLIHESSEYHHRFMLYDPDNKIAFTDILEIHSLELSADERARMLYDAREKERRDNHARERGAIIHVCLPTKINSPKSC